MRKCFVDYCGPTVPIVCAETGEIHPAQVFVAVLGASNYTYAEATRSQSLPDWLGSHVRTFEYFGGSTAIVVPDNLRSGVTRACRYDPDLNASYQQWAEHYQVAVVPARPYKPKDKSKAEVGVQIVERWILARLRHHTFFSLAELNQCIRALLDELNEKPFKQLPGNRRQAFEQLDQPALKPLPRHPYRYVDYQTGQSQYRLPRAVPAASLLGSAPVRGRDPGTARQRHADHALLPPTVGGHPCAQTPAGHDHRTGPHAQAPPETPAVDTGAVKELGSRHRPCGIGLGGLRS